jgi:hypothetical protein
VHLHVVFLDGVYTAPVYGKLDNGEADNGEAARLSKGSRGPPPGSNALGAHPAPNSLRVASPFTGSPPRRPSQNYRILRMPYALLGSEAGVELWWASTPLRCSSPGLARSPHAQACCKRMDDGQSIAARLQTWVIACSLAATAGIFLFFVLAPAFGYPLEYAQAFRLIQVVLPTFVGYLATATVFLASKSRRIVRLRAPALQLKLVTLGPLVIFALGLGGLLTAFGYTNRADAAPGAGMSVDLLATMTSVLLALLAATTTIASEYLFPKVVDPEKKAEAALTRSQPS